MKYAMAWRGAQTAAQYNTKTEVVNVYVDEGDRLCCTFSFENAGGYSDYKVEIPLDRVLVAMLEKKDAEE